MSTIIMIAITVVLAAVAFVLIADVGGKATHAPTALGFRVKDEPDRLEVSSVPPRSDWSQFSVRLESDTGTGAVYVGNGAGGSYHDQPAATTGGNLASSVQLAVARDAILGGQFLEFCRAAGGTDGRVVLQVFDLAASAVIGRYDLESVHSNGC